MGLLAGKTALIFGVANKNSIAWGITKAFHTEGAQIGMTYAGEALGKRVMPLAAEIGCEFVEECDVQRDEDLDRIFAKFGERYGKLDILVHSVAYARSEDMGGRFIDISRDGFKLALDISAYSLIAMCKRAEPLMPNGGSVMSLTYYAAEKVMPKYNAMAVAKAALETMTRYLAADMGPRRIRVNAISAGPIKTLAAMGVPGFRTLYKSFEKAAPMRDVVTQDDVGQAALWLASDMSRMVTGEILHVDGGYNVLGLTASEEELRELDK
ncbi:MAG: enoyl-ACP reductase [Chloroflexi bacterium]|nr:enoyl-ACP reductase [Chloroflexota bacterium]